MRFPSKVTTFNESIMAKFPLVLEELENYNLSPNDLYSKIKKRLNGIQEFVEIIVCLYTLNKIEFAEGEVLRYVKKH